MDDGSTVVIRCGSCVSTRTVTRAGSRALHVDNGGQGDATRAPGRLRGEVPAHHRRRRGGAWAGSPGMLGIYEKRPCDAATGGFEPYSMETPVERYLHYQTRALFGPRPSTAVAPMMSFIIPGTCSGRRADSTRPSRIGFSAGSSCARGGASTCDPSVSIVLHYQRNWAPAASAFAPAIRRVYDIGRPRPRSRPTWPIRRRDFSSAPVVTVAVSAGLYGMSLRMEAIFWAARMQAYFATFTRPPYTPLARSPSPRSMRANPWTKEQRPQVGSRSSGTMTPAQNAIMSHSPPVTARSNSLWGYSKTEE